jgi:hypothetical protein
MPGPLPKPDRRRRNAPTIPTTNLPASGRTGPAPVCPYELAAKGTEWWEWAWSLPQACAWDDGALFTVARRARLEDDIAAMNIGDELDLTDLLAGADREAIQRVEWALATLKRLATAKLSVEKEMRELDGKLGLNPEALAKLRWTIVDDSTPVAKPVPIQAKRAAAESHLRAV